MYLTWRNNCAARLLKRTPVIAVIAVIGSTEESAVDPLRDILDFVKSSAKGLDFAIHCDAAWGGYFNSMYLDDEGIGAAPEFPMSNYVGTQYRRAPRRRFCHRRSAQGGYVPYAAGGLCYRNSALRDLVSLASPVVFHSKLEPTVGIYGIEGSKPGAAAAAVYLAHKVIRPDQEGIRKDPR